MRSALHGNESWEINARLRKKVDVFETKYQMLIRGDIVKDIARSMDIIVQECCVQSKLSLRWVSQLRNGLNTWRE